MSKVRIASLFVMIIGVQAGTGVASAQREGAWEVGEPEVAARALALTDLRSGEYLAGEHAAKRLPIASTTKIMAALVVLEKADPGEELKVSKDAAYATPAYSNVGLLPGETPSLRELLVAALIFSGDDAAYTLAEPVGGGGRQHRSTLQAGERVDLVAQGSVDGLVDANSDVERDVDLVRICRARRKVGL